MLCRGLVFSDNWGDGGQTDKTPRHIKLDEKMEVSDGGRLELEIKRQIVQRPDRTGQRQIPGIQKT